MDVTLRLLKNDNAEFKKIYKWCKNKFVYEWFEQRILSENEIINKYKSKLEKGIQKLFIIQYKGIDIGLVQLYKFEYDIQLDALNDFKNIYEYDLFIGEEKYLSKGIGTDIVKLINEMLYSDYKADAIILRPFKRNIRAIKCYEKCNFKLIADYDGKDTLGNPEIISVLLNTKKH
ncbi:MAG: GNAT family N-acetyltransferase [Bacilli bacterium]|nr:GNAT family N-acetyltransferase [Bacilli bacterium]